MNPTAFIGVPDWRSALLALLFTLPWLVLFARRWLRRPWPWLALVAAMLLFPISIAWIQVPIQEALGTIWTSILDADTIRRYVLLVGLPSIVVSGIVQESVKLLVAVAALRALGAPRDGSAGLACGGAAGAGYGGFEAFWVFNQMFVVGWSWAMVQLGGPMALAGFFERFFTVPFHIGAAALSAYGFATGRPWRFLLLAIGLHSAANYGVLLLRVGALTAVTLEVWVAAISVVTVALALWARRRSSAVMPI